MIRAWLDRWKGWGIGGSRAAALPRVLLESDPAAIYAVGDVHGCLDLLLGLEQAIVDDAEPIQGDRWIVMLGDLVDRGEQSAQVLDHLLEPAPAGFHRACLMGNHEAMMLDFLRHPSPRAPWLEFGGRETLMSYGAPLSALTHGRLNARDARRLVETYVPDEHLEFLLGLPVMFETPSAIFVHAGLRPGCALPDQLDSDLISYRDDFEATYEDVGRTVVHGHTVRETALVTRNRIAVDTGAYVTGQLTAVRICPGKAPALLSSTRSALTIRRGNE